MIEKRQKHSKSHLSDSNDHRRLHFHGIQKIQTVVSDVPDRVHSKRIGFLKKEIRKYF